MSEPLTVRSLASFDRLIAPVVIKAIYWIGLVLITIGAIIGFFSSFSVMGYSFATGLGQMLLSVIGFAVGVLVWRVLMEVYIVFFNIHDRLTEIRDRLGKDG
ncbi:MAG: hypothetical protein Tsb008_03290 [Rhodothalassiaceae bacterium]